MKLDLPLPPADVDWSGCQVQHTEHIYHHTKTIHLNLKGRSPVVTDMAGICDRNAMSYDFEIWDWGDGTFTTYDKYCPAQDAVSWSIDVQKIWESFETALVLDILHATPGDRSVMDIGAHIGWYTAMASRLGWYTVGIEADPLNAELAERNSPGAQIVLGYVDKTVVPLTTPLDLRLLIVDIEGNEPAAANWLAKSFRAQSIEYAMLEISPVFARQGRYGVKEGDYATLVKRICDFGYTAYQIPHKGWEHTDEYIENPLATLVKYCQIDADNGEAIEYLHQENFVFKRT